MKKKFLSLLLAMMFALCAAIPVQAISVQECGSVYLESDVLDSDFFNELGEETLPALTEKYHLGLRVDILGDLGDQYESLADAAETLYDYYEYGYPGTGNGLSLTVLVHEDETGLALDDWVVYSGGTSEELRNEGVKQVAKQIEWWFGENPLDQEGPHDQNVLLQAVRMFAEQAEKIMTDGTVPPLPGGEESSAPAEPEKPGSSDGALFAANQMIVDTAGLLSERTLSDLGSWMRNAAIDYDFGIYAAVLDDYTLYTSASDPAAAAKELYEKNDLGIGAEADGILLMLSVDTGDYQILNNGFGTEVFREGEPDADKMMNDIYNCFAQEDWDGAFTTYVEQMMELADKARNPGPQKGALLFANGNFVADPAGNLKPEEVAELEKMAKEAAEKYQFGIYIASLPDYTQYSRQISDREALKEIYLSNDLGFGAEKDGVILMLSMKERNFYVVAHGFGNVAFTDFAREYMIEQFLPSFKDDKWYDGFTEYMEQATHMVKLARKGKPFTIRDTTMAHLLGFGACTLLALLAAWITTAVLAHQLRSVAKKTEAKAYVTENGVNLTEKIDDYTHTTQTRVYEEPKKSGGSGSSGGGGTSVDSSGFSGSGGSF